MHVCSQPAIRMICDGIEEALRRHPAPHRHRIEHAADYLIEDADIERVQRLGLRIITTPAFIYAQGDVLSLPNSQRDSWRWWRTLDTGRLNSRSRSVRQALIDQQVFSSMVVSGWRS